MKLSFWLQWGCAETLGFLHTTKGPAWLRKCLFHVHPRLGIESQQGHHQENCCGRGNWLHFPNSYTECPLSSRFFCHVRIAFWSVYVTVSLSKCTLITCRRVTESKSLAFQFFKCVIWNIHLFYLTKELDAPTPTFSLSPTVWAASPSPTPVGWELTMLTTCSTCLESLSRHHWDTGLAIVTSQATWLPIGPTLLKLGIVLHTQTSCIIAGKKKTKKKNRKELITEKENSLWFYLQRPQQRRPECACDLAKVHFFRTPILGYQC